MISTDPAERVGRPAAETRMKPKGVLSVDDTLLSHYGQHFDEIAYLYDPVQKGFTWAHNLVTLHYD